LADDPHRSGGSRSLQRNEVSVEFYGLAGLGGRLRGETGKEGPDEPSCSAIAGRVGIEDELLRFFRGLSRYGAEQLLRELLHCPIGTERSP
jgi:hypothetical protein